MAYGRLVDEYTEEMIVDGMEVVFLHVYVELFEGSEAQVYFRGPNEKPHIARCYYASELDEGEVLRDRMEKTVRWGRDTNHRPPKHYVHVELTDHEGHVQHCTGQFYEGLSGKDMLYSMKESFFWG